MALATLIHLRPVLFLGGPAVALLLNLLAIGTLDVRWENHVLAAFVAYAFVENFAIVPTHV